jgi:hypothetical protein
VTRSEWGGGALADAVAATVVACPAVAGLADGPAATYLPGRKVTGVAVRDHVIAVSVIARWEPLPEVVRQVRAAVVSAAPGRVVDVDVADIAAAKGDVSAGPGAQS